MATGTRAGATTDWDREVDVAVLGHGSAGCAAAIAAHDAGARVLVIEKMPPGREGGNTRVSGGIWFNNPDPEASKVYLRSLCGNYPIPEAVIDVWATETHANTDWLVSLGADVAVHGDYAPEYPELEGSESYGGYMGIGGEMGGGRLYDVLAAAVAERGIEVLLDTPGRELVQGENGDVLGILVEHQGAGLRVRTRGGVVIATGGFENNPEMVRDYLSLSNVPIWGTPAATGDGIKMAQKAGADLWHMDNMMTTMGIRVPDFEGGFYVAFNYAQGFLWVGADGQRCMNELPQLGHGQAYLNGDYPLFPTQTVHVVFDERTRKAGPISPPREDLAAGWNVQMERYDWSRDNQVEIDKGWLESAATLAELAGKLGIDAAALEASVARFNAACEAGEDAQFGRDPRTLQPIAEGPYYGFTSPPMIGWSNGGPRRDERAQVLDPFGLVIPGLYAAGCVSSTYSWCKDGGMHIADSLAFGRVAGRGAASRCKD